MLLYFQHAVTFCEVLIILLITMCLIEQVIAIEASLLHCTHSGVHLSACSKASSEIILSFVFAVGAVVFLCVHSYVPE